MVRRRNKLNLMNDRGSIGVPMKTGSRVYDSVDCYAAPNDLYKKGPSVAEGTGSFLIPAKPQKIEVDERDFCNSRSADLSNAKDSL